MILEQIKKATDSNSRYSIEVAVQVSRDYGVVLCQRFLFVSIL